MCVISSQPASVLVVWLDEQLVDECVLDFLQVLHAGTYLTTSEPVCTGLGMFLNLIVLFLCYCQQLPYLDVALNSLHSATAS